MPLILATVYLLNFQTLICYEIRMTSWAPEDVSQVDSNLTFQLSNFYAFDYRGLFTICLQECKRDFILTKFLSFLIRLFQLSLRSKIAIVVLRNKPFPQ